MVADERNHGRQATVGIGSYGKVHGRVFQKSFLESLGHTAKNSNGNVAFLLFQTEYIQASQHPFFSVVPDGTGIDEDDIRLGDIFRKAAAGSFQYG